MITTWLMRLDRELAGAPDELLSLACLTIAGYFIYLALRGSPSVKAISISWAVAP